MAVKIYGQLESGIAGGFVTALEQILGHKTIPHYARINTNTNKIEFINTEEDEEALFTVDISAISENRHLAEVDVESGYINFRFNDDDPEMPASIRVPLAKIFDAALYYKKTEINELFGDIIMPFSRFVTSDAGMNISDTNIDADDAANIVYDRFTERFYYLKDKSTLCKNWSTTNKYMDGDAPLQRMLFWASQSGGVYFYEGDELRPICDQSQINADLTEIHEEIDELMDAVFPVGVTLTGDGPTLVEFTGAGDDNSHPYTLTWNVTRKGTGLTPDNVVITKKEGNGAEQDIANISDPTNNTGTESVSVNYLGTTEFRAKVQAEGQSKTATFAVKQVLPMFVGYAEHNSELDAIAADLAAKHYKGAVNSLSGVNLTPNNIVEGHHFVIAIPKGRTLNWVKSGGYIVEMNYTSPKNSKLTISGEEYEYVMYYSPGAHEVGPMGTPVEVNMN